VLKASAQDDFVVVAVFRNIFDADLASTKLKAAGIPVSVSADDCGGMRPNLQLTRGVRVLVPARSAKRANRLLQGRRK
jgi:hypothetical protein